MVHGTYDMKMSTEGWWSYSDQGNMKYSEKTPNQWLSLHHKSHMSWTWMHEMYTLWNNFLSKNPRYPKEHWLILRSQVYISLLFGKISINIKMSTED